jgi:hypothetical protein
MTSATEGAGTVTVKASDAQVFLVVVATPPFFKGNQTYSYEVLIGREGAASAVPPAAAQ